MNPVDPQVFINKTIPADFPIQVNEDNATVTVAGGISQRALIDYLALYTHWKQPIGWTIPSFSWFIDQSVAGAVSTGTHGSSTQWGSISSQLVGMKVVLANGTLLELKSPEENPHLWNALALSVGRLGVIVEVTLKIVPNELMVRTGREITFNEWVDELHVVQENYKAALAANDSAAADKVLAQIDETMVSEMYLILFNR